jgi:orotate phosphoribosyltransferase
MCTNVRLQIDGVDRKPDGKRRALAKLALERDIAAEETGETPRDGQSQSSAVAVCITAGGGTDPLELLENAILIDRGNPDTGVAHLDVDPRRRAGARSRRRGWCIADSRGDNRGPLDGGRDIGDGNHPGTQRNRALRRVLDGVAQQIDENLAEVRRVGPQTGEQRPHTERDRQAFLVCEGLDVSSDVEDEGPQVHELGMHFQAPSRHLREIEDLVHQLAQMARRCLDAMHRCGLARRQLTIEAVPHEVHEADDCIERRAELMRYVGEKLALDLIGAQQLSRQSLELSGSLGDPTRQPTLVGDGERENQQCDQARYPQTDAHLLVAARHERAIDQNQRHDDERGDGRDGQRGETNRKAHPLQGWPRRGQSATASRTNTDLPKGNDNRRRQQGQSALWALQSRKWRVESRHYGVGLYVYPLLFTFDSPVMAVQVSGSRSQQDRLARLATLLAERSARRGDFTLSSGKRSSLYIDARLTTMHPTGLTLVGPAGLWALRASEWGRDVTSVGGLTLGADPVAYAISYASALETELPRSPIRAFTVRKEAKTHGTGKLIEGAFQPGDRVAIVEDVITTGGSAVRAVEGVRAAGGIVAGVLALVDREEGGREALESAGLPVIALVTAREILAEMGR